MASLKQQVIKLVHNDKLADLNDLRAVYLRQIKNHKNSQDAFKELRKKNLEIIKFEMKFAGVFQ